MASPTTTRRPPSADPSARARLDAGLESALSPLLRVALHLLAAPVAMILPASAQPFSIIGITSSASLEWDALLRGLAGVQPSAVLEVLLDVGSDERFAALPELRFYIGVPLITKQGQLIGTLCVIDSVRRSHTDPCDLEALQDLAAGIASQLEWHGSAARLEQERNFYDAVAQNADFLAIATDALGCVARLNPCAEQMLGIDSAMAEHQPIWALFSDPVAARLVERAMRRVLCGALVSHGELSWLTTDGSRRHAALSCSILRDGSGAISHVVITGIDTSALRRSESAARRSAQATDQALSARGEFFNFVTHELRTPLHAISGYCDLLLDPGLGSLSPDQIDFAKEIRSASDHLFALISDLLDLSKLGAGAANFAPKLLRPAPLLRSCLSMLKTAAQQNGVILSLEVGANPAPIYGDERSVRQILVNLLSNAVKFTSSGGSVRLSLATDGDWQRLMVTDTGIGLLEDDLAKIFEPFTQARNSPAHHRSFGLGLTLSQKLAELHGGRIEVSSQLGIGSSFTLVLPSAQRSGQNPAHEKHGFVEQSGL